MRRRSERSRGPTSNERSAHAAPPRGPKRVNDGRGLAAVEVGAKNYLFIGHPDAGERSAIIYSMVVSCQRRGIEPHAYLKDVLTRLPTMTNRDDLSALTPAKWKPPAPT